MQAERHDILAWQPDMPYTGDLGKAITALWMNDQGVKAAFAARTRFTLSDGAQFFFEKAIAVSAPGYTPTVDDVLRVRKPVTAVAEDEYWIEHVLFHIVHVGGQVGILLLQASLCLLLRHQSAYIAIASPPHRPSSHVPVPPLWP